MVLIRIFVQSSHK